MRSSRSLFVQSALVLGAVLLSACAAKYSQVPPRMDLVRYGRVALASFGTVQADSAVGVLATERFAEAVLQSQSVELLELAASDTAWSALADSVEVPAVFVGRLEFSKDRPRGSVSLSGLDVRSTVTADLSVRLVSTETGGTLWRSSSQRRITLGSLAVNGTGLPTMSLRDADEAYATLVNDLVVDVTRDLRESWVKQ